MKIDIWSDVVCPYCYIGKRHLEAALQQLPELDVEIRWKSFELDPNASNDPESDIYDLLANKYGHDREWAINATENMAKMAADAGLEFKMDQAKPANSFNAHQLIHLAADKGKQDEMKERLLKAYFNEGKHIGKRETLAELAETVGIDKSDVNNTLENNSYSSDVMADVEQAHRLGIQGVPFFLINEKYGLSGAQPTEVFIKALKQISEEEETETA